MLSLLLASPLTTGCWSVLSLIVNTSGDQNKCDIYVILEHIPNITADFTADLDAD